MRFSYIKARIRSSSYRWNQRRACAPGLGPQAERGFFFRAPTVSLSQIEFRKRTALGMRQEERWRENAADFFERYLEVEHLLGVDAAFQNPLKGFVVRKPEAIETAALKLSKDHDLRCNCNGMELYGQQQ